MSTVADVFIGNLARSEAVATPYRHWLMDEVLPADIARALDTIDIPMGEGHDYGGRRECNNSLRAFFTPERQAENSAVAAVAEALRDSRTIAAIETTTGCDLAGSLLRIEYCQDGDGFWLEPHTDIGAKRFTLLCYLSAGEGSDGCGTDIFDRDRRWVRTVPFRFNSALVFVPGPDTWHGFNRRTIVGVRRTMIVNYVPPDWRARQELAFPAPVR